MASSDIRYYRVSPRFWSDERIRGDDARLLALYLLTCPHRNIVGLYRLPKGYIQEDLGWTAQRLAKPFAELLEIGFIEYDEERSVVLIVKALKYDPPANDNVVKAAVKQISELPQTPLLARLQQLAEQYCERLAKRLLEQFGNTITRSLSLTEPSPPPTSPSPAQPASGRASSRSEKAQLERLFDERFWPAYPRKQAKAAALKAWFKLKPTPELVDRMLEALARQRDSPQWTKDGGAYIPYPATWLNQARWEDEVDYDGIQARREVAAGAGQSGHTDPERDFSDLYIRS